MATDKLFYEYATLFPNALAKFVHAESDDYETRSITFKETEKRADIFLIGQSGQHVVLVEPQGYKRPELFYDMVKKMMFFCTQHKYRGQINAVAIFLKESHLHAAKEFFLQFRNSSVLTFTPKIFVFSRITVEELDEINDIHLTPLYPLCNISANEIKQEAPGWAETIKTAKDLSINERDNLLSLLGGAISHRIKKITSEGINELFGGFTMEDTPLGQELIQMGEKKGIEEGIPKGIRQVLLKLIAARFGTVPREIQNKIQAVDSPESLERIATMLLTIQSIDELKDLVN